MSLEESAPDGAGKQKRFRYLVDGASFSTDDRLVDGRTILRKAGKEPPSGHILIELTRPGSRSVGLDEQVDLKDDGREEFRAFRSDRTFSFTLDETGYEWGDAAITVAELRDIAGVPANRALFLLCDDGPRRELDDEGQLELSGLGTERVVTARKQVTVYYGDDKFELDRGVYTGAQLAAIFDVPDGHLLDLIKGGGKFEEISPDEEVRVKDGMKFGSHPPCGQSS
jgi:hypothetical protein